MKFNGRFVAVGIGETEVDMLEVVEAVEETEDKLGNLVKVESFDATDVARDDDVAEDSVEFDDARETEELVLIPEVVNNRGVG